MLFRNQISLEAYKQNKEHKYMTARGVCSFKQWECYRKPLIIDILIIISHEHVFDVIAYNFVGLFSLV